MQSFRSPFSLLELAMDAGNGSFLDHVGTRPNLRRACRHVVANAGAPGVDGLTVDQLARRWPHREGEVSRQLSAGIYAPSALRRCAVPKGGGKGVRTLGIPTVLDRVVQQAIVQPLSALLDVGFSPRSFGFRPGRCAQDALLQAGCYVADGLCWVLHLDLEKFFDHASHDLVLSRLQRQVSDPRLVTLIRRFLTAPFQEGILQTVRSMGLPQGGPLSPLLANVLLDGLDQRLFDAGFHFCRYADDICIYFCSAMEAREALAIITPWIEVDLHLPINRQKTRIVPVEQDVFLSYRVRLDKGRIVFSPSTASIDRLRSTVRGLFDQSRTTNPRAIINRGLVPLFGGWARYFSLTSDQGVFDSVDRFAIIEFRCWLWRRLGNPHRRAHALIERGVPAVDAWRLVCRGLPVRVAVESKIFCRAFPLEWFQARGWLGCAYYFHPPRIVMAGPKYSRTNDTGFEEPNPTHIKLAVRNAARRCGLYEWRRGIEASQMFASPL